jgi:hypothetical protein
MAKGDTVYSLFGLETPQQVAAKRLKERLSMFGKADNPYQTIGTGIGYGLASLFAGPDEEMQKAEAFEEIQRDYQPGNIQNMAETYTRLKEAGAPAETLQRLSGDITAASEAFNVRAEAQREKERQVKAREQAVAFISQTNPDLGNLVASEAMSVKDGIEAVRKAQEPIKVGDVLGNIDPKTKKFNEIYDARQRKPNTTYEILTEDEKKQLGITAPGLYQRGSDGKVSRIAGADLPQLGTIPVGYQVIVDTDENNRPLISMQPMKGSPQERELQQSKDAVRAGKRGKATKFTQVVAPSIDLAIEIAEDPENWATGKSGAFIEQLGKLSGGIISAETSRLALTEQLTTIRANIGFDKLQRMRDESPTGGALGQVALGELYALQSSIAPLNPNMKDTELVASLNKVKANYRKAVEAVANDLTDEQLIAEGLGDLIPFRTANRNPDGSYTPLEPADDTFDITSLPQEVQDTWEFMTEDERALWR